VGASNAAIAAGLIVVLGVLILIGYIVKKLGANMKTAALIAAIIIALGVLLTRLPAIIQAFQLPPPLAAGQVAVALRDQVS
jgi:hypothetical protein